MSLSTDLPVQVCEQRQQRKDRVLINSVAGTVCSGARSHRRLPMDPAHMGVAVDKCDFEAVVSPVQLFKCWNN